MFKTEIKNDVAVIIVNLKSATQKESESFKKILLENIKAGYIKFVIDISQCNTVDATFLSTMIAAYQNVANRNGKINIVAAEPEVEELIEITKMNELFLIFADKNEALKNINFEESK